MPNTIIGAILIAPVAAVLWAVSYHASLSASIDGSGMWFGVLSGVTFFAAAAATLTAFCFTVMAAWGEEF